MRRARLWVGPASVVGLALLASACSNSPSPSARANGSTTTARAHPSTSSSTSSGGSSASAPTTAGNRGAGSASPTLGVATAWGPAAVGFGMVKPAEISLGGDPTGMLTGITWQSWAGDTATGTGTSTYVGPGQTAAQGVHETATVVAAGLGSCGGNAAYEQVKWYFPEQGETLSTAANSTINTCSGP